MIDSTTIGERLEHVRYRIVRAGGELEKIKIIAVTKGFGPEVVTASQRLGLSQMGESYAQELLEKARIAEGSPEWHFIGRLQSNKVKLVAPIVSLWQSVDRMSLISELSRRAPGANILIEVNTSQEQSKGGCLPVEVPALVENAREAGLNVAGLMTIAARGPEQKVRSCFSLLAELADDEDLVERSMGMSGDYEIAVQEGATMLRLGQALYGQRFDPRNQPEEVRHWKSTKEI